MGFTSCSAKSRARAWTICCSSLSSSFMSAPYSPLSPAGRERERRYLPGLFLELLELFFQQRDDLEEVPDQAEVGDPEDGRLRVLVHGADHLGGPHAGQGLDGPRGRRGAPQPASTAARDAPTAAPRTLARSSSRAKFSGPLSPRPPETTTSASVSSGSPVCASSRRSPKVVVAAIAASAGGSTAGLRPACSSAALKTFGRRGASQGV